MAGLCVVRKSRARESIGPETLALCQKNGVVFHVLSSGRGVSVSSLLIDAGCIWMPIAAWRALVVSSSFSALSVSSVSS